MLTFILAIKLVAEIALMALLGQGVLALLAGAGRHHNPIYQLLGLVTRPVVAPVRFITPRGVATHLHPVVAFLLLAVVWLAAVLGKVSVCVQVGMAVCR